jgi:hypothetical protein
MNDVSEIREELARIASDLRSEQQDAVASRIEALNLTFFTTTTEYLVESLDMIDEFASAGTLKRLSTAMKRRIESLRTHAQRLTNLR